MALIVILNICLTTEFLEKCYLEIAVTSSTGWSKEKMEGYNYSRSQGYRC